MKIKCSASHLLSTLAGILLAVSVVPSRADDDVSVSRFDNAGSLAGWRFDYGGVTNLIEFDPGQDANTNAASGSLKVSFGFDAAALNPSGNNKGAVTIDLPAPLDGSTYLSMELDVKIAPGSAADGSGNSGYFQMVIRNTGSYSFNSQFGGNVSTNNGWRHIRVAPLVGAANDIRAITLELYGGAGLTGPLTLYLDNVKFTKPTPAADVIINRFNDAGSRTGWRFDYGGVTNLIEFDPSQDANASAASGSLKVSFGFDAAALNPSGNNKGAVTIDLPAPLDGSTYLSMEMDLRIEPGSAADGSGNSGFFQMVIRNTGNYSFNSQFGANVSTNSGWRHIRVSPLAGGANDIRAITLELYGGAALTGPVILYIDNLKFTKPLPANEVFISQFNDLSGLAGWRFDYGGVTNLLSFDSTEDGNTNAASGSLKATFGFDAVNLGANNKGAITIDLSAPLDASSFLTMEMDVKIAPGSADDGFGGSGFLQMVIRNTGNYDFNSQFGANVNANDGWRHLTVSPLLGAVNDIRAITLDLDGGSGVSGPVTFYIDNLKFSRTAPPPLGPAMSTEHPIRGLNLIPTSGQYQRQNIATVTNSGYSWVGSASPVTYALTIGVYPDALHSSFQTHVLLVAGTGGSDSFPDYSQANVIFLDIQSQASGSAYAAFRYKTNEANGNAFLYGPGTLGGVSGTTPAGTWSMTFSQDTNVTVTAPGGATYSTNISPEVAALFADPLTVFIGDQPNAGGNVGQTAVMNRFQITNGGATLLDDNFLTDQSLDAATWRVAAGDASGVQLIGPGAAFWLSWTTPDSGFVLQTTTTAADANSWAPAGWIVPQMGSRKRILIHSPTANPDPNNTYEPDAQQSYFRLLKTGP